MSEDSWLTAKLPTSWATPRLGDLCDVVRGGSPRPMGDPRYFGGSIPFVKISDVSASDGRTLRETMASVTEEGSQRSRLLRAGSLILSNSATICVPVFLGVDACIHDGFVAFDKLSSNVSQEYLFHFFNYVRPHLRNKHKQGVTQVNLNTGIVGDITLPLPPLAEQKRIVAKIEELFSELEAGEESLRVARRQLGVYRQSLLKQAFEGKLTAKWRTQNPAKLESWVSTTVAKVGRIETGTTPPTDDQANYGGDLPFLKPTDLEQGRYVKTARSHLSAAGQRSARVLPAGSVLVTCIGATIGKTGLAQLACATNQQINSISPTENIASEFAYFQVISPQFQEQIKTNASSTTLPILNKSKFSALPFVRCSLPEQQEIVRLLDEQFEVIERNEREIDGALRKSEALRQAILQKAFTGRLVPQDPSDEPASHLLARLRTERAAGVA